MIKAKSRFLLALCVLTPGVISLGACTVYTSHEQLTALNYTVPSGAPFVQRLAVEYRDMANQYHDQFDDYDDAAHFSRKGLQAASGEAVLPEEPTDWRIADDQLDGMHQGRDSLIDLLDHGGRDKAPDFSAVAQARFDCWVVEATRIFPDDDTDLCRGQFKQALDQARAEIDKPDAVPQPIPQSHREDDLRAAKFLVFFDWNKANVTSAAERVIDTAISEARRLGAKQIDVIGNADKSGSERYNQKLSMARALAVKKRLEALGIPAGEITAVAHGDDHPLVETARGVREPANRRVEIHFE